MDTPETPPTLTLAERAELVRQATPIYKAMLCSLPFYKERENDDAFWSHFIGSQVTAARTLVARAKAGEAAKPSE